MVVQQFTGTKLLKVRIHLPQLPLPKVELLLGMQSLEFTQHLALLGGALLLVPLPQLVPFVLCVLFVLLRPVLPGIRTGVLGGTMAWGKTEEQTEEKTEGKKTPVRLERSIEHISRVHVPGEIT
jgi:hypothetical protein